MINVDYNLGDKYIESSFRINANVKDPCTGQLVDPSTIRISIKNPVGVLDIDNVIFERDAKGKYHYDVNVPINVGQFIGRSVLISTSGKKTIRTFAYWAEASI